MNSINIKIKILVLCFLYIGSMAAQEKLTKVAQTIKVDKDAVIQLNTSHCNIVFDTWNKNLVEIEAYIEGKSLSKEELEKALNQWHVDVDATGKEVIIRTSNSQTHTAWISNECDNCEHDDHSIRAILNELKFELADIPMIPDLDFNVEVAYLPEMPIMPEMPRMPELPELPEGVKAIAFDFDAYQKNGEKYLKEWSKKFEEKYGNDYVEKMEVWGKTFGKKWSEKLGKEWGGDYAEQLEKWGKEFAERMEDKHNESKVRAELIEEHKKQAKEQADRHKKHIIERTILIKNREKEIEKLFENKLNPNVKKTIKIKMPKDVKLKVNVRHGEIELADNINNLQADLSYTKFIAKGINGSLTSINASYSPIYVSYWDLGELNLKYVKNVELKNVNNLVLNSMSSSVDIENLLGNAIIDGNIGDIKILNIGEDFKSLNMIIQNSDVFVALPKADHNLQFKGTRTQLAHPERNNNYNSSNFSAGSLNAGKNIVINAKYSHVTMK